MDLDNSRKRRKANSGLGVDADQHFDEDANPSNTPLVFDSMKRSISPPTLKRRQPVQAPSDQNNHLAVIDSSFSPSSSLSKECVPSSTVKMISSPVQLSTVKELPASSNIDTLSLKDILGDPLIKECWLFNYLFDVDFVM